jgi:hypothetical protein
MRGKRSHTDWGLVWSHFLCLRNGKVKFSKTENSELTTLPRARVLGSLPTCLKSKNRSISAPALEDALASL